MEPIAKSTKDCSLVVTLILLFATFDASAQSAERLSTVDVGKLVRSAQESVAIPGKFAGKPSIDLYLFAKQLTPAQRQNFVLQGSNAGNGGIRPIGHLMFFFQEDATACQSKLISNTAVFQRTKDFAIPVLTDTPINWAYPASNPAKYGVRELRCRLAHGARLTARVNHRREINKSNERQFFHQRVLPDGMRRLNFRWDVNVDTTLFDRNVAFQNSQTAKSTVSLQSTQIVDADAIYLRQYKAFTIRFYDSKVSKSSRGNRASANDSSLLGFVFVTTKGSVERLSITHCTVSIRQRLLNGDKRAHDAPCDGNGNRLRLSGGSKVGTPIVLSLTGAAPAERRLKRPKMSWDLRVNTVLNRVFDQ